MKTKINLFVGTWVIVEMEAWDQEYVNMEVPGHFQFGLVRREMDCHMETVSARERIEFSWDGQDELDPASGRGWVVIENEELHGRIFFHQGDDSTFRARRS